MIKTLVVLIEITKFFGVNSQVFKKDPDLFDQRASSTSMVFSLMLMVISRREISETRGNGR